MKSEIFIFKTNFESVYTNMSKLIQNLSLPNEANKIAIKINLCEYRRRETGAVSDPLVVDALVYYLKEIYPSSEILLVENDASTALADVLFSYAGFTELAKKYEDVKCVNLAHDEWITKNIDGYHFKKIKVPKLLNDADLLITHPKLKTNSLTKITCGLKNMFGCIKQKNKYIYHKKIDEVIVDINLALKPCLSIVDAIISHEGIWGPAYGTPKIIDLLIGGKDVVAVDAFCSKLMGFRPLFVGHIRKASAKGLGNMSFEVKGDLDRVDLGNYKFDFNRYLYYSFKMLRTLGFTGV